LIGVENTTGLPPTNYSALKISVLAYSRDIANSFVRAEIQIIRVLIPSSCEKLFLSGY